MYKLKKGIEKLSTDDLKIISVLLESLDINHLAKLYYAMTKKFFMRKIHKLKNQKSAPSITIVDSLNTEYNHFSDYNNDNTDSFLNLLELKYKGINANGFDFLFYNMIQFASELYLLPKDITPAKKADLISTNAYITVLKNLRKIAHSLPESKIKLLEENLDSFIIEMEDREHLVLEEILKFEKLTGKKVLELLTKENSINNIAESSNIPRILIKTVNTVINTLIHEDKVFTQVDSKPWTFILFEANREVSWILEVSPLQMIKGSKHLTQEMTSMIIFLSKVLLRETYLPLDHQLPSFNLTQSEKNALVKRNERFNTLTSLLDEAQYKIKVLEDKLNKRINAVRNFMLEKDQYEKTISLKKGKLIDQKNTLNKTEEQFMRLTRIYETLHLKKTSNPRVEKKILSLKENYDDLSNKISNLKAEIREIQNSLMENETLKKQSEDNLLKQNKEISKLKIEVALFKRQVKEYEQEKHQLKSSNAIYFSVHWGKYFNALKFSPKIYDALLSFTIDSLLLIERILVELNESTVPKAVGHKMKENTYMVHVKKENKSMCEIIYKVNTNIKVLVKEIIISRKQ